MARAAGGGVLTMAKAALETSDVVDDAAASRIRTYPVVVVVLGTVHA